MRPNNQHPKSDCCPAEAPREWPRKNEADLSRHELTRGRGKYLQKARQSFEAIFAVVLVVGCGSDAPACGNGRLEGAEVCESSQAGCSSDCRALCGDHIVGPGEACEPFQTGCSSDCRSLCGDGVVQPGEVCDVNDLYCAKDCRSFEGSCGDGHVHVGDESCDDANAIAGDGCTGCKIEGGFACAGEPSVCRFGPAGVDPSRVASSATRDDINRFCNWLTDSQGGEGAHLSCGESSTGVAIVGSAQSCIDSFPSTFSGCTAALGDIGGCWYPILKGGDVCAAAPGSRECIANACAGHGISRCSGAGCPREPCSSPSDCFSGTYCAGDGRGWCTCDVPGATACQPPTCTSSTDCAKYGPGINCVSGSCSIVDKLPQGAMCEKPAWCKSGVCNGTCGGDHDMGVGGHCENLDWCEASNGGPVKCCGNVCTLVSLREDCSVTTGGSCSLDSQCISSRCVNSRCA